MNKKITSAVLTIVLCLSLIAGSTYALFTSEDSINIAVTSGEVKVVATILEDGMKTYSLEKEQAAGKFANGGTADFVVAQIIMKILSKTGLLKTGLSEEQSMCLRKMIYPYSFIAIMGRIIFVTIGVDIRFGISVINGHLHRIDRLILLM